MIWPTVALITVIIFWASIAVLLTRWPRVHNKSISQHAAASRSAYIFFTTVQVLAGLILYLFVIKWFIPTFHMSLWFTVVYSVTAWLQILSAFLPDTMQGVKSDIHRHMANAFALGIFLSTLLLCVAPTIHGVPKLVFHISALYMLALVILSTFKKGKPHLLPQYLWLQVLYIVAFQASIMFAAFSR